MLGPVSRKQKRQPMRRLDPPCKRRLNMNGTCSEPQGQLVSQTLGDSDVFISDADADKFAADFAIFPVPTEPEPIFLLAEDWKFLETCNLRTGNLQTGEDFFDQYGFFPGNESKTISSLMPTPPRPNPKRLGQSTVFRKKRNVCLFFMERFQHRNFFKY